MSSNQKMLTGTKKEVIDDLQKVHDEFYKKNKKEITRGYYRTKGKYSESLIEKYFGSFTIAKKELKTDKEQLTTREDINIKVVNKDKNKKYFISAIIPNAKVNECFWGSILKYCEVNDAQPLLFVMRGVESDDSFSQAVMDKYSQYFVTEYIFNSNLIAKDFMLSPQQILPLSGLQRYGGKKQSLIIAHSKQMLNTIPKQHNETPHIVFSTGTICEPTYRNTRQGQIAKEDNCLAGWVIEVKDNIIFHQRAIRHDGKGFQDLNRYYTKDKVVNLKVNSLICEPHIGVESKQAIDLFKEVTKLCEPKNIFIHDSFDALSVNPHTRNKNGLRTQVASHQESLEKELNYLGNFLEQWQKEFPNIKFYHVYSNHNYFVNRYLEDGEFTKDKENIKIGAELFLYLVNDKNPIEEYLKKKFNITNNIFLKKGQSFIINDCEMNTHGHAGSNGSKGSFRGIEIAYNKAIIGHSHSYNIWRDVLQIPCLCELQQIYNSDGASSWLHGNGILFENGMKQAILYVNNEWKL